MSRVLAGGVIKKESLRRLSYIPHKLHTAHSASYRTLHKLPRPSTNYCTRHKLPCLGSMRRGGEARKNIMIIQQQSNIAITIITKQPTHAYRELSPLPSTLKPAVRIVPGSSAEFTSAFPLLFFAASVHHAQIRWPWLLRQSRVPLAFFSRGVPLPV